jgi:putative AbiEii toxin of type IV toxin-antitoxin system/AAA ATPase-like protein/uncharacterized protein DUF3696
LRASIPHFTKLHLRNFRGFRYARGIPLVPLTFLVGPNSSGKSSIFDALLFLAQSAIGPIGDPFVPNWTGPLVDLGSYKDVVFRHYHNVGIRVGYEISYDPRGPWRTYKTPKLVSTQVDYGFRSPMGLSDPVGRLSTIRIRDCQGDAQLLAILGSRLNSPVITNINGRRSKYIQEQEDRPRWYTLSNWMWDRLRDQIREPARSRPIERTESLMRLQAAVGSYASITIMESMQRVASGREAPKRWYSLAEIAERAERGEEKQLFDAVDPAELPERSLHRRSDLPLRGRRAKEGTLGSILKDIDIARAIRRTKLSPYHSAISVLDSKIGVESKLIDVGYGASQVIPVIQACLSASGGPLLVEQPEIHLHPKAQSIIADLLCKTSLRRQVIVETHSEHMINRARILVATGELKPEDVIVNYVLREKSGSRVISIPIGSDGEFLRPWPDGFFDERYQDTMTLLRLSKTERGDGDHSSNRHRNDEPFAATAKKGSKRKGTS